MKLHPYPASTFVRQSAGSRACTRAPHRLTGCRFWTLHPYPVMSRIVPPHRRVQVLEPAGGAGSRPCRGCRLWSLQGVQVLDPARRNLLKKFLQEISTREAPRRVAARFGSPLARGFPFARNTPARRSTFTSWREPSSPTRARMARRLTLRCGGRTAVFTNRNISKPCPI
jgi:hypothetical protein